MRISTLNHRTSRHHASHRLPSHLSVTRSFLYQIGHFGCRSMQTTSSPRPEQDARKVCVMIRQSVTPRPGRSSRELGPVRPGSPHTNYRLTPITKVSTAMPPMSPSPTICSSAAGNMLSLIGLVRGLQQVGPFHLHAQCLLTLHISIVYSRRRHCGHHFLPRTRLVDRACLAPN